MRLTIELVPRSVWYKNLRSILPDSQWDRLRKECYRKAQHVCEICGGIGDDWRVECHEVWNYDDKHKVITLERLIALCPKCHQVKHIGLAQTNGKMDEAIEHLMEVNQMIRWEAISYIEEQFRIWYRRSKYQWVMDITNFLREIRQRRINNGYK